MKQIAIIALFCPFPLQSLSIKGLVFCKMDSIESPSPLMMPQRGRKSVISFPGSFQFLESVYSNEPIRTLYYVIRRSTNLIQGKCSHNGPALLWHIEPPEVVFPPLSKGVRVGGAVQHANTHTHRADFECSSYDPILKSVEVGSWILAIKF